MEETTKRRITLPAVRHKNMAHYQTCTTVATLWTLSLISWYDELHDFRKVHIDVKK
jgi:hypothetical protein